MDQEKNMRRSGLGRRKPKLGMEASLGLGKMPPQAIDLEEAILGALMLEKDAVNQVIEILKPESFYKDAHSHIYKAILDLFNNSEPVDLLTVTNQLRKNGQLEAAGGAYHITELTSKVESAANVEHHARLITEMYIKRELIHISSEIQRDAFENTTDVFELLDDIEGSLFKISESTIRKNYEDMSTIFHKAIKELGEKKNQEHGLTGVATGFTELDRVTSGWQKSDLVILAARPGMGKTAFVLSMLRNAAIDFNKAVAIFSLEMSSVQLVNRLIAAEAELDSEKIKKGNFADHEWEQLVRKTNKLSKAPIFIDDTPALSILELRAKSRRLRTQHNVQLIVIDYLQLMSGESGSGMKGNREQEIANISRSLKSLAKELEVPVIALSQLSRNVENRGGSKRPQLSDLRESGSIEQDADMVMFIYRPEYYNITQTAEGESTGGLAEIIIAKHRSGSLGDVPLRFIGKYTKFTDWTTSFSAPLSSASQGGSLTLGSKANDLDGEDDYGDLADF